MRCEYHKKNKVWKNCSKNSVQEACMNIDKDNSGMKINECLEMKWKSIGMGWPILETAANLQKNFAYSEVYLFLSDQKSGYH